jgi:hypothetical protein
VKDRAERRGQRHRRQHPPRARSRTSRARSA